jgi:hypothetical protein
VNICWRSMQQDKRDEDAAGDHVGLETQWGQIHMQFVLDWAVEQWFHLNNPGLRSRHILSILTGKEELIRILRLTGTTTWGKCVLLHYYANLMDLTSLPKSTEVYFPVENSTRRTWPQTWVSYSTRIRMNTHSLVAVPERCNRILIPAIQEHVSPRTTIICGEEWA